jgi:putative membrane protein
MKNKAILFFKGIAMGAADVVPGVSGGTIAFITGIYEELISTIDGLSLGLLKTWKEQGFKSFWKESNLGFLSVLLLGIATSIVSLAKGISYLLATQPILVWSFFFGLVLSSVWIISKSISRTTLWSWLVLILTAFIAFYITGLTPIVNEDTPTWYLMLSGALAICAMILPGISGSFILVLLGSYEPVLNAIHQRDLVLLGWIGAGMLIGIFSFAKILKWLFTHYKNITLMGLTGFVIGSLNKIWPWKEVLSFRINSKGEQVPFLEKSILPAQYDGDPQVLTAVLLAIAGFLVIWGLEFAATKLENK